jgi:hypothetical protein
MDAAQRPQGNSAPKRVRFRHVREPNSLEGIRRVHVRAG